MPFYEVLAWGKVETRMHMVMRKMFETVGKHGGVMRQVNPMGRKDLPFYFKQAGEKHSAAQLVFVHMDISPSGLKEVERMLKLDEDILRFMATKQNTHDLPGTVESVPSRNSSLRYSHNKRMVDALAEGLPVAGETSAAASSAAPTGETSK